MNKEHILSTIFPTSFEPKLRNRPGLDYIFFPAVQNFRDRGRFENGVQMMVRSRLGRGGLDWILRSYRGSSIIANRAQIIEMPPMESHISCAFSFGRDSCALSTAKEGLLRGMKQESVWCIQDRLSIPNREHRMRMKVSLTVSRW